MKAWPVQHAKAHFSQLLQESLTQGPQLVTKHGSEAAVLVSVQEWRRFTAQAGPGFKTLLLAPEGRTDLSIPRRGQLRRRDLKQSS